MILIELYCIFFHAYTRHFFPTINEQIALSDVAKFNWSRPTKSDKGAIILYINGQFNLYLWSKNNLDEWMFVINESVERNRVRRSCVLQNGSTRAHVNDIKRTFDGCELYENTAQISNSIGTNSEVKQEPVGVTNGLNSVTAANQVNSGHEVRVSGEQDDNRSQTITKFSGAEISEALTKLR